LPARWYWHGNEPDIHASWIYAALGRPDDGARWVRWTIDRHFTDGPDGLAGNDDSGTLSAWVVFSEAGFYPLAARGDYLIGSPVLTRSVFHLEGGDFVVEAPEASPEAIFVQRARWGDGELDEARLDHDELAGGTLHLEMGPEPAGWGTDAP
jgi:putative alpha-1,2-mannosidase